MRIAHKQVLSPPFWPHFFTRVYMPMHMLMNAHVQTRLFMRSAGSAGHADAVEARTDPHAVAGLVKLFLRELENPLLSSRLYPAWIKIAMVESDHHRIMAIRELLRHHLPREHADVLGALLPFLYRVSEHALSNKVCKDEACSRSCT